MPENQLIHEFMKNSVEKVKVEFCSFHGKELINIRAYYNADVTGNEWRPTKKGIALSLSLIPELKQAIEKAQREWERKAEQSD